jgi:hypothetical protein
VFENLCSTTDPVENPIKELEKLGLECTSFELKEVEDQLERVIRKHQKSLKHISFAKNNISIGFI